MNECTEQNPKGSGRPPRAIPGVQKAIVLDQDLFDFVKEISPSERGYSAVVNLSLRLLKNSMEAQAEMNLTMDKPRKR